MVAMVMVIMDMVVEAVMGGTQRNPVLSANLWSTYRQQKYFTQCLLRIFDLRFFMIPC